MLTFIIVTQKCHRSHILEECSLCIVHHSLFHPKMTRQNRLSHPWHVDDFSMTDSQLLVYTEFILIEKVTPAHT